MSDVGTLTIKLNLTDQGLKAGLANARGDVQKTAGMIRQALSFAGGMLLAQGFRSAVGEIGGFVSAASDANETVNKLDVVFGDSAAGIEKWAQSAATSFGVSTQQAEETAATFGNLFQAMGLGQAPAADMSRSLVGLAADLGSFNNIDPKQVLLDLQSGMVGEIEPLRKYGIEISDNALQQEALAEGISKSTQEMTQAEKIQLRYNIIMKQTAKAQGDFARTSHGLANETRILHANIADLRAGIGQALLPTVLAATDATNRFFDRFNDKRAQGLGVVGAGLSALHTTLDQTFGKTAGDIIDSTLRGIVSGVSTVTSVLGAMGGALAVDLKKGDISGFFLDLRDDVEFAARQGIDLGVIVVKAAFKLAETGITDLWGWVIGQLGFGGGSPTNPITGFGNTDFGAINPTAGRPVDIGNIFVTATLALGGAIADLGGDIWGWLLKEIGVTAGGQFLAKGDGTEQQAPISLGDVFVGGTLKLGGDLLTVAADFGGWLKGKLVTGATDIVALGEVAIDATPTLAKDFWGTAGDAWSWLEGQIGVGGGGNKGGFGGAAAEAGLTSGVSLGDVTFGVGQLVLDAAADLGSKAKSAIQGWFDDHPGVSATLNNWTLYLNDPSAVNMPAPSGAMTKEANNKDKQSTTALLAKWYLTLQGEPITDASQAKTQSSIEKALSYQNIVAHLPSLRVVFEGTPIIGDVLRLAQSINEGLNQIEPVRAKVDNWNITFSDLKDYNILTPGGWANIDRWLAGKVEGLIPDIDIHLPSWNLSLPSPDLSFGGTLGNLGNLGGIGTAVTGWILEKIGGSIPDVSLPSWNLSLPTPDFPDLFDTTVMDWIETTIDAFDLTATIIEGVFHLSLPTPDFPDLSANTVIGWISDKFKELGDITIPWPNNLHITLPFGLGGEKSGSVLGDIKNAMQGGGTGEGADTSFALPAIDLSAFEASTATAQTDVATMRGNVLLEMQTMSNFAVYWVDTAAAGVESGFRQMQSAAIGSVQGLVSGVLGELSSLANAGYDVGLSLGDGIAQGISATVSSVAASAANVVNAAVAAAKAAGKVSSPSRVMWQVGGYFAEGFALGMLAGVPRASYAGGQLARAAVVAPSGMSSVGGRRTGGGNTYNVTVNVEHAYTPADLERSVAKAITEADVAAAQLNGMSA